MPMKTLTPQTPFLLLAAACLLLGCGREPASAPQGAAAEAAAAPVRALDKALFQEVIAAGPVAGEQELSASTWASAVREAGVLRIGGTRTSFLFSQYDEQDHSLSGFDAGIYQLLARYILGDASRFELTQIDSATREAVLQNGQVDAVIATYSITDRRRELVGFAGPYFTSRQAILVRRGRDDITAPADLAGRRVATQKGSTGPGVLREFAPQAAAELFANDTEARAALRQGRVDAYVTDLTLLLSAAVRSPGDFQLAGEPFGPEDHYGIGVPRDSDAVPFINAFLQRLVSEGLWQKLWHVTIGARAGIDVAPQPPQIAP